MRRCAQAITDIVDGGRPTQEEFLENLSSAAAALQSTLPRVLQFVSGKTLSQL
jgi:5'-methylthioadenosine nucleosidase